MVKLRFVEPVSRVRFSLVTPSSKFVYSGYTFRMNTLYFLIGASGAGKTTAAKALEKQNIPNLVICHFDSIGVPTPEEMERDFGGGENWQRVKTIEWVGKIKDEFLNEKNVILDAQTRPSFIKEGCEKHGVENYKIILFDCSDQVRKQRLINRGHSELADDNMMNWAKHLRERCVEGGHEIIDTSDMTVQEMVSQLVHLL